MDTTSLTISVLCSLTLISTHVLGQSQCQSTFCFNFWSRNINVDINLFNNSKPLPIEQYIRQFGYPVESHEITTQDGYILTYHRIPHGKSAPDNSSRPAVLLQHGLLASSAAWILANYSLAYSLADAGFDVWLGNARGTTYSRKHQTLDPDKDKHQFWDFSWHEMGYYDLPASIDYILNTTDRTQLFYVGHSMGTTMYFVLGATRPEYMDKVQAAVAMAPVIYPWNLRSYLANFLQRLHTVLNGVAKAFGIYEVFPYSDALLWIDRNICANKFVQFICKDLLYFIGGLQEQDLKRTNLQTVLLYMPAGTSYRTLRHFRQICEKKTDFRQFDYGYISNVWKYKSLSPPVYTLTNVNAPLYVYYATSDWLSVPEDVEHAVEHLPNVKKVTKISDDQFNHLDFMWAVDANKFVYDDMIFTLRNISLKHEDNQTAYK